MIVILQTSITPSWTFNLQNYCHTPTSEINRFNYRSNYTYRNIQNIKKSLQLLKNKLK